MKRTSVMLCVCLLGCAIGERDRMTSDGGTSNDGATNDGAFEDGGLMDGSVDGTVPGCPEDSCALGTNRCSGSNVQSCEANGPMGCPVWTEPTACAAGLFCSGDECTDTCADVCVDGARQCSGDGSFQVCATQASGCLDWNAVETCPAEQTCQGEGVCAACTSGEKRCGAAGQVEECVAERWTLKEGCAFGCNMGACVDSGSCTPSAYQCNGTNVETCNSSGSAWLHLRTCAVACNAGLCTGACTPDETRCNGAMVETCNAAGTAWDATEACTGVCSRGTCVVASLEIATSQTLEGEVIVDGPFIVRSGASVTGTGSDLTIRAQSIVVENGGSISVPPHNQTTPVDGRTSTSQYSRGGGGAAQGSTQNATVGLGGNGGNSYRSAAKGGKGGGVLRLFAENITIAGTLSANGGAAEDGSRYGAGGGAGGGILVAGNNIVFSGIASASGGPGGDGSSGDGTAGAEGYVKLLHGSSLDETGAMITGRRVTAILPPTEISSTTHPNPNLYYNDGFPVVAMSWTRPFSPLQGYYWLTNPNETVPSPSNAEFVATEVVSFPVEDLQETQDYFRIASVTPTAMSGEVGGSFRVQINRTPPTVRSESHTRASEWSTNSNPFFDWTFPHDDENFAGVYYVFDRFGDTIPTAASTFVPVTQKQVLLSGIADGIWALHVVAVDTQGYLTLRAGHRQIRIGEDPGTGSVFGQITDSSDSTPVSGATISINRGLFPDDSTNSTGNFNIDVSAGTWELRVSAEGYETVTQMVTVGDELSIAANIALTPKP